MKNMPGSIEVQLVLVFLLGYSGCEWCQFLEVLKCEAFSFVKALKIQIFCVLFGWSNHSCPFMVFLGLLSVVFFSQKPCC